MNNKKLSIAYFKENRNENPTRHFKNKKRTPAFNGAVLRQAGCNSAESLVGNWKCIARMNVSEPPPERKAANTLGVSPESVVDKVSRPDNKVQPDKVV
jgi:hypothetical protein